MLDYDDSKEYLELEKAVLGSIILESWAFDLVSGDLKPYCFEDLANQHIFKSISDLKEKKEGVDYLTISQDLKNKGLLETVGGAYYVMNLTEKVASASNIETHARLIIQRHLERKIKEICQYGLIKLSDRGFDVFDVFEELKTKLESSISDVSGNKAFDTIETLAGPFMQDINDKKNKIIPPAITYGLYEIDKYGGANNSDLIYIGARPGMGKTAFIIKALRNCVIELGKPAGIFSLEMNSYQLLRRIASAECQINGEDLRTGNVTDQQINDIYKRINELKKAPLYIDDKTTDIEMLISKAKKMKRDHKIEELVIDYLGFITAKGFNNNKNGEITHISRKLKGLAKDLDIPVICLAQLSRGIEERKLEDRFPKLSDLRDSGSIEQDADQVIFLFRPDYYGVDKFFLNGREIYTKGRCFISYAKNRHGVVETKLIGFRGEFTEFYNLPESMPTQTESLFDSKLTDKDDLPF